MERRVLAYLFVSAFFMFFMLTMRPRPPLQDGAAGPNAPQQQVEADNAENADEADEAKVEPEIGGVEGEPSEADEEPVDRPKKGEWYTLGSLAFDPESPESADKVLITFSNRGAAIERIELIEREPSGLFRYRRVDTRSGYLGYLAPGLPSDIEGVRVNVVAPGSPADLAGLQVGDIITSVANRVITSPTEFDRWMLETEPGQELSLEVLRKTAITSRPLP
ncbi:MAG: PDZ domain-containing protein [Pirellulaceae bacterium]